MQSLSLFRHTRAFIIILALLVLIISILRLHYYDWPPNRDVTTYAVISHELIQDKKLYSDIWDIKPPAIFITYAAAEAIFGYGPNTIYLMNLACALIILIGVYMAGLASGYGPTSGIWAALFWTALTGDISLQLHDANTEAFMNACLIWAFVLFLTPTDRSFRNNRAVVIGLLFAWSSLYKQAILAIPFTLSIAHIALPPVGTNRREAIIHILIIASIGAAIWGVVVAHMALTGRFQIFYDTVITHSISYAGSPSKKVAQAVSSGDLMEGVRRLQVVIPLLTFASIGILFGLIRERSRSWALIVMYALGACISIAAPGKFYRHYFQLGLPPLVVVGGWTAVVLTRKTTKLRASIPQIAAAIVFLFIVGKQLPYYQNQPDVQLNGTYAELYLVTQKLGRKLASIMKPDETMFQWGSESGLYYFSKQRPPSSIHGWSHLSRTFGKQFTTKTLKELKMRPPDLVVLAKYFIEVQPDHPVLQWINENYCPVVGLSEKEGKYFALMAQCGSSIESRMLILDN